MNAKILHFDLTTDNPHAAMKKFWPQALNRTEWRGMPARSCCLRDFRFDSTKPKNLRIVVEFRPKGYISFVGRTKYDAWTLMAIDQKEDGTLLDGNGNPLAEGKPPFYRPFEVYQDIEFNDLDFGTLVEETELLGVGRVAKSDVFKHFANKSGLNDAVFTAPRRSRQLTKIVLAKSPSTEGTDRWGGRLIILSENEPYLDQVILKTITDLVCEVIEGKVAISGAITGGPDELLIDLSSTIVDATGYDDGLGTWFNVIRGLVPVTFLDDLAKQLMSLYDVDVKVLDGGDVGLYLKREKANA